MVYNALPGLRAVGRIYGLTIEEINREVLKVLGDNSRTFQNDRDR